MNISAGFIFRTLFLIASFSASFASVAQAQDDPPDRNYLDTFLNNLSSYSKYFTRQAASDFTIDRVFLSQDASKNLTNVKIEMSFVPARSGRISPINAHVVCTSGHNEHSDNLDFSDNWSVKGEAKPVGAKADAVAAGKEYAFEVTYTGPGLTLEDLRDATCILDAPIRMSELDGVATASASFVISGCNFGSSNESLCIVSQLDKPKHWFRAKAVHVSKGFTWSPIQDGHITINAVCSGQPVCLYTVPNELEGELIAVTGRCLRGSGQEKTIYQELNKNPGDQRRSHVSIDCR